MFHRKLSAAAVAAGLGAILVLGRLPSLEPELQERRAKAAFSAPHRPVELSDDNLADALADLPLKQRMIRAGWDHRILSIDLTLRQEHQNPSAVWSDMAELIRFSFGGTGNVRQLLIRIYEESEGRRTLLFYGDSRREDWAEEAAASIRPPETAAHEAFLRKTGAAATEAGERWLRNLAI